MQAGKLRHRVTIQRKASGVDTLGQSSGGWVCVNTCWASVRTLTGNELEKAKILVPAASTEIIMRYNPDTNEQCRAVFKERIFNIGNVNNIDQRNIQLTLICSEAKSVASQS
jgi:SPP1 family predicted phage head-tail adaptor